MSEKWFPKKLTQMEEFLPEALKPLRNYVKHYRNDDISFELHMFEERVLFSEGDKNFPGALLDHTKIISHKKHIKLKPGMSKNCFCRHGWKFRHGKEA